MNKIEFAALYVATMGAELNSQPKKKCVIFVESLDIPLNNRQKVTLASMVRQRCGRGSRDFAWLKRLYEAVLTSSITKEALKPVN